MKWFKHMTNLFNDEKVALLVDECGLAGYGFYMRLLEIVAENFKAGQEPAVEYPIWKWQQLLGGIRPSTFFRVLSVLEQNSLVTRPKLEQNSNKTCKILIHNLLKLQDEYSKKSGVCQEFVRSKEEDIDKNNKESNILTNITKESSQPELEKTSLRPSRTCVSETSSDETPEKSLEADTTSQASEIPSLLTGKKEGLANEGKNSGKPKDEVPYTDIVELYHQALPDLPKVLKLSEKRKSFVKQRWDGIIPERLKATGHEPTRENKLLYLKRYFEKVSNSTFLTGRSNAGFKADFEWLIRPENFVKVIEGRYS